MTQISESFLRSEFKCKCGKCDYDTVDTELIEVLQDVRDHFGLPVKITSGNRCPDYNKKVGGATHSYHPRGRAADIQIKSIEPHKVYSYLVDKYPDKYGIGKYNSFTHIDTRTSCGRW